MKFPLLTRAILAFACLALAFGIVACGDDEDEPATDVTTPSPSPTEAATTAGEPTPTEPPATPDATVAAEATPTETPSAAEATPAMADDADLLAQYAAEHAGGPGAIFVGDPMQLVGLPPHEGLMYQSTEAQYLQGATAALIGVSAMGIPGHTFIYTSEYYQNLIKKANLTNPTELTSSGESIEIQHTCIDRNLPTCVLIQAYWAPNLAERTNGQVKLSVVSFVELGLSGPETLDQVGNGTLDMVNIFTGYIAGVLPALEVQSLWGTASDWETSYLVLTDLAPDIDRIMLEATGGSQVLNRNWFAGSDQWFFGGKALTTLEDFDGLKVRSHSSSLSDFLTGMGAEPVFLGPAEIYTRLERGFVDAAATTGFLAVSDRLYEIAQYMNGPLIGFGYTNNVINKEVWDNIPADLQQIIMEEGAKTELEALRLAPFQNIVAPQINQSLGLEIVPFNAEIISHINTVVVPEHVLPGWLQRLGYPGNGEDVVAIYNEKVSPYNGLQIGDDGSIEVVPITKGPRAQ